MGAVGVFWTPTGSAALADPQPELSSPIATTANETMTSTTVSSTLGVALAGGTEHPRPITKMISGSALSFSQPVIPALDTQTSTR